MTFVRRKIEALITLGVGQFGETKGDTVRLSGLRMSVSMRSYGKDSMGALQMRIFGLPLEMISKLTSIGPIATQMRGQNRLQVYAGDDGDELAMIFDGTIDTAWGDFNSAPDVALNISGYAGYKDALTPIAPSSYKGSADVADVLAGLAKTMGLAFERNAVSVQLSNPYFPGTALEQVKSACRAADILWSIDNGILAVWPRKGSRGVPTPILSSATGLVGYPTFTSSGLSLKSIFTPTAKQGGKVQVDSSITAASGTWVIFTVVHELESETIGGSWFTGIECGRVAVI